MKQICINAYEVKELSDKAREHAYYKWLEHHEYFWSGENKASLYAFADIFPCKINDWSYGGRGSGVYWTFTEDDSIAELSGWRLSTYLWNNYGHVIYNKKYRNSFRRSNRIIHPMVTQKLSKDRQTGEEYYWTKVHSNLFVETYNCPLTGYYIDNSLFHPIWEFMKQPSNTTFQELLEDCFSEWVKDCEADYEYSTREEAFIEDAEANEWTFDESGRIL